MKKLITLLMTLLPVSGIAFAQHAPQKATEVIAPVINDAPEGTVTRLNNSGTGYRLYDMVDYSYVPSEIVECDNGEVYLKNPLGVMVTNSYIKGQKEGNRYVFNLPQAIYTDEYWGSDYILSNMQYYVDEYGGRFVPANSEDAKYHGLLEIENTFVININEDGSLSYASQDEGKTIIGYYDSYDLLYYGYGVITSEWTEFTDVQVSVPDNIEPVEMVIESTGGEYFGKAILDNDNNEIYIQGIFAEMPEAWVKGTIDGNKATFMSGQYLGENYGYYTFFVAAGVEQEYNEEWEEWYDVLRLQDSIVFEYDSENEIFSMPVNEAILLNRTPDDIQYITYLKSVVMRQQGEVSKQIANPTELVFDNSFELSGFSSLGFNLSIFNTDGDLLNTKDIYYSIFVNGEEFVFSPGTYNIEEEMVMIPYDFTDYYDFEINGTRRTVYFYTGDIKSVGVKEYYVYREGDEEMMTESDLITIDLGPSNVGKVTGESEITSVTFYNLAGQKVNNPNNGVFIKKVSYADGTTSTFKVTKK